MLSTNQMIMGLQQLLGREGIGLSEWEAQFIDSIWKKSSQGKFPNLLTGRQVEQIVRVYHRYHD